MREENRRAMRAAGPVVWLSASAETIHDRMSADLTTTGRRPDLTERGGLDEIIELLASRRPIYQELADVEVDTEAKTPEQLAAEILDLLQLTPDAEDSA